MEVKIYKSYGVLAHERQPYYSWGAPASEIYDVIAVDIPGYIGVNDLGEPLVDIGGETYLLHELLSNRGDDPVLRWYNGQKYQYITLQES